ncbi:hypothetical protein ACFUJU_25860 [Streptomyces sp. NPDC057235]|uniref:hypothetical protein n=1 Tax=Streptomyces sp. NPDC057235 TaxID=3346058 RepID=UPI00362E1A68
MPTSHPPKKTTASAKPAARATAGPDEPETKQGFGITQAVIIGLFLTAAVVLRLAAGMEVNDIVVLLSWVAGIAVVVILTTATTANGSGPRRLLRRILSAAAGHPAN